MQPVLNVCHFSLGSFTLLPCCLKGKKKKSGERKNMLSAFQICYLMMALLPDGDFIWRGVRACVHVCVYSRTLLPRS